MLESPHVQQQKKSNKFAYISHNAWLCEKHHTYHVLSWFTQILCKHRVTNPQPKQTSEKILNSGVLNSLSMSFFSLHPLAVSAKIRPHFPAQIKKVLTLQAVNWPNLAPLNLCQQSQNLITKYLNPPSGLNGIIWIQCPVLGSSPFAAGHRRCSLFCTSRRIIPQHYNQPVFSPLSLSCSFHRVRARGHGSRSKTAHGKTNRRMQKLNAQIRGHNTEA